MCCCNVSIRRQWAWLNADTGLRASLLDSTTDPTSASATAPNSRVLLATGRNAGRHPITARDPAKPEHAGIRNCQVCHARLN
jgi:hypothetical protein